MTTKQKLDLSCTPLLDIFSVLPDQHQPEKPPVNDPVPKQQRRFIAPQPSDLMFGNSCLHQHLEQAGQKIPIIVADFLNDLDWSAFEAQYATTGRPPYAPRNMAGLILFGIMQGITSLRGLETLARLNLGCMWVSGGIFPDHANIGRFIVMHAEDALRETMQHPAAKKVFKQRKAMVEPVFGHLRTVQGLNRFRRRGLSGVKLEFSLHILAYNPGRVVAATVLSPFMRVIFFIWCRNVDILMIGHLTAITKGGLYEPATVI